MRLMRSSVAADPQYAMRKARLAEDAQAVGGMKHPAISAAKIPAAGPAGGKILRALSRVIDNFPGFVEQLSDLLRGNKVHTFPQGIVAAARGEIARSFRRELPSEPPRGICPDMFCPGSNPKSCVLAIPWP